VHLNLGRQLIGRVVLMISMQCIVLPFGFSAPHGGLMDDSNGSSSETVYEVGPTITSPKLVHYVEPAFSANSKEAFVEGTVKISTVVTLEGKASDSRVVSGLNAEEDRTALEALKQWRFQPGTKDGKPVKVRVTVEVDFHLL
jgi:protein TonB